MGQKVRPTGFRVGIYDGWRSRWYASKHEFKDLLVEDFKIRKFIKEKYGYAGIPKIEIERTRDEVTVHLFTARPGVIIGSQHTPGVLAAVLPLLAPLTPAKLRPVRTTEIARAMVAAALQRPGKSAIYHYPEMMALIAGQ